MKQLRGILVLSMCLFAITARAADDPQTGIWKMDVAKSKYVTSPAPQSSVATITPYGKDGVSLKVDVVTAKGEKFGIQYSGEYDGKHNPRTEIGAGAISGQTVTLERIDPRTVERILYLAGKPVGTERWNISADGKTRIVTQSGIDSKGKPIDNVQFYVKQ